MFRPIAIARRRFCRACGYVTRLARLISSASLFVVAAATAAQEVVPDFYREPGIYPNRAYVNQHFAEHIDPFTGALQQHFSDIHIPGPAGFDLKLTRSYSSNTFINAAAEPALQSGIGWTMHFGRVLKRGATFQPCQNHSSPGTSDNPVLELPDGSRQIFYWTGSSPIWMTTQRWVAHCNGAGTGLTVWSPDGIRYEMTHLVTELVGATSNYSMYATAIYDRNGNSISISYMGAQSPKITQVSAPDGRILLFDYASGCSTNGQHVCSVSSGPNSTWFYDYQLVPNTTNRYFLTRAVRPDGATWTYEYNGLVSPAAGSYLLRRMTYPQGGTITYGYALVNFINPANPAGGTAVVASKTTSDGGNWTYSYTPGGFGINDQTVMTSPSGTTTFRHVGAGTVASGDVWRIGLLMEKTQGSSQIETYSWSQSTPAISFENNVRNGGFATKVDTQVYAPVLTGKIVNRNGATYSTAYSNFDSFGNPRQIVESGPNNGNRTTQLTYYTSANPWIVRQVDDETTVGVGTVVREWDGLGRLLSETRDGISTRYTYYTNGDVFSITRPRELQSTFSNYYRGIPQIEAHPEAISITRIVDAAGNVTREVDGEGWPTTYSYDGLNRLTQIVPPSGPITIISYPSALAKVATKGALVESTSYDGFGRTASVTVGGIATTYRLDPLGRRAFQSYPNNSTAGTTTTYDILDRPLNITHADGTYRSHSYGAATTAVRDERNFTTTYSYRAYGDPDRSSLIAVAAPVPSASLSIGRNGRDLVTSITQDGVSRTFGYDPSNGYYLTSATHPETGQTIYGRDAAGNMTSKRVGASTTIYEYDGMNRLWRITYPGTGTPQVVKTYSRTNKLRTVTAGGMRRTYKELANGLLFSEMLEVDGLTNVVEYQYDASDHLALIKYPRSGRVVDLKPDALGRPTQASPYVTSVTYWPNGQVNRITFANGSSTTYGQDLRLRPNSVVAQVGTTKYVDSVYGYDNASNLTSIVDSVDSTFARTLIHDGINRLATANGPWGAGTISYNGRGDITRQTLGAFDLTYAYDGTNRRLSSTGGSRIASYSYDVYGNVTAAGATTYAYDEASNLLCVACASASRVDYRYDGTNTRISVDKGGVRTYEFHDVRGNLLVDWSPSAFDRMTEYIYIGGKRVAQRTSDSRAQATVAVSASPNPATATQNVTLTATVTGGVPAGGMVEFRDATGVLGTASVSGSSASLVSAFANSGTRRIVAEYLGNTSTGVALSAPFLLTVNVLAQPSNTTASASPTPADTMTCVRVTATVTGQTPTGTVTLSYPAPKGTASATATLVNGSASFPSTRLAAGSHNLSINYSGDSRNFASSTSLPITITQAPPPPPGQVGINPPCDWRGPIITGISPSSVNASRVGAGAISASATMQVADGVSPFSYSWSLVSGSGISASGSQTGTFSATMPASGSYSASFRARVVDGNGATATLDLPVTFTSTAATAPTVTISPSPLSANRAGSGTVTASATASATGGAAPYTYSWTQLSGSAFSVTGANTATATFSGYVFADWCWPEYATGTFRVTVTGSNGLSGTKDLTVSFSGSPGGTPPPQCEVSPLRVSPKSSTK